MTGEKYAVAREKMLAKKKEKKGKESESVLNEIAKLKGFKGRQKVEKIGEKVIKIIDMSPLAEWAEYHAKELGFMGRRKGEKIDGVVIDKSMTSIEEFVEYMVTKTKRPKEDIVKEAYMLLIPQEEISKGLEVFKEKWFASHEKFMEFCDELARQIREYYKKNKTTTTAITMSDMFKSLEQYHMTHPKSMNIYSTDELIIGLGNCLPEKGIRPMIMANKTAIKFEAVAD